MCESQVNLLLRADSSEDSVHPDGLANYLVEDIIRKHTERGLHEESSCTEPSCWSASPAKSRSRVDQRLEYWKNMLVRRRALQQKLRRQVGRDPQPRTLSQPSSTGNVVDSCFQEDGGHLSAELLGWEPPCEKLKEDHSLGHLEEDEKIRELQVEHTRCDCSSGLCVRINGVYFRPTVPEFPPIVEPYFICDPFQRLLRTVIRIENCGNFELHFIWLRTEFFSNNDTLFRPEPGDFVFDSDPFFLAPGDIRDVSVLYQPRCVAVVKQSWLLVPRPQIFFSRPCGITLNIHGCCTAPKEYLERLALERPPVPLHLEPKPPLDKIASPLCPYVRELEEREAFSQRNRSFQCRRHADMKPLKKFFEMVKSLNGFPVWNFSVHTLIHLVCAVRDAQERIRLFSELTHLLESLRGAPGQSLQVADTPIRLRERWRTKLIFVRGILASCLQEWVDRVQFLRRPECFPGSLYMLLHGLLCQAAEDIVSVIESTAEI